MSLEQKNILLVEDEGIIALREKTQLEKYGYTVISESTGEKAVERINENKTIDLILMDIDLGSGIDGTEAAELILKDHDIPVLFLSSHNEPEVVNKTERITSYGYVVKNSGITVLDASIKMAFKLFEANRKIKKVSEALLERNNLLENTMENFPGCVFWKDTDMVYLGCNTSEAKESGAASPEEVIGKSDYELGWTDNEAGFYRKTDRLVLEGGKPVFNIQECHRRPDGETVWEETTKVPLFDLAGKVSGIFGVSVNITERKRAEEALRNSEEKYRGIIEQSLDGIIVADSDGRIVTWNASMAAISGIPKDEAIGRPISEIKSRMSPGEDKAALAAQAQSTLEEMLESGGGSQMSGNWTIRSIDGTHKAIQESAFHIKLHDTHFFGTIIRDITDQKKTENLLEESEGLYRSILNASPDAIAMTDLEGRILMFSPAALGMFGYDDADGHLGCPISDFIVPEDRERAFSNVALMRQGKTLGADDYRGLRRDGSVFDMEINGEFVRDASGDYSKMVFIIRDISRRRQAGAT